LRCIRNIGEVVAAHRINLASGLYSPYSDNALRLNTKYLEAALQRVANPDLLVNIVSRRVRQLAQGHRPMTQTDPRMDHADVALKEIGEGKIGYEIFEDEKVGKE
jgi:DNA-directed RNA polymerase subunit omega